MRAAAGAGVADEIGDVGAVRAFGDAHAAVHGRTAGRAGLVVNTSSVGMKGSRFDQLDLGRLPRSAVVTDIVYVPLVTPLLEDARAEGLRTVDGLGMLLHQAVPGFEAWFGVKPEVTPELRALVEATL